MVGASRHKNDEVASHYPIRAGASAARGRGSAYVASAKPTLGCTQAWWPWRGVLPSYYMQTTPGRTQAWWP